MANKKVVVDVEIKADIQPSIAGLKELKKQLKTAAAGSDDFKKISAQIRDTEDALQGAKKSADDFGGFLESAPGPLGVLGRGFKSVEIAFSSFNGALKASIIGILVTAIGGLVAAFSKSEVAMKKLQPIFIAFEKILGGIFRAFEPVLDIFVEMAMKALPIITTGIGGFYSALFSLFTFIKTTGLGIGKILKGIFTLDFDSVEEGLDGLKNVFSDTAKSFTDTYKRFEDGTKEVTKTEKENEEERRKIADEARAKREKAAAEELAKRKANLDAQIQLEIDKENTSKEKLSALLKQRYEAELQGQKLSDAQKQVLRDANTKKIEESLKADADVRQKAFDDSLKKLQDASKAEQDQLNANLNEAKAIYGENSAEARKTQDDIFNSQAATLKKEKELLIQKQDLTDAETARLKSIGIEEQNLTTTKRVENEKRIQNDVAAFLKSKENEKVAADAKFAQDMELAQYDFELQQKILDEKIKQDEIYYASLLANENLTADEIAAIKKKRLDNDISFLNEEEKLEQKRVATKVKALDDIISIVGQESVVGRAALIAKQLLAAQEIFLEVRKTITFSTQALARSKVAVAEGTARTAKVGFPQNIPLLIGYAAQAAGIISAIISATKSAKQVETTSTSPSNEQPRALASGGFVSGPGTGTSDSIPAMLSNGESVINARSTNMFKPLLSTINRIGGGRQFAEGGIATTSASAMNELNTAISMSQQPIKTYVVAQDMSSMQQFDRASKSRSTL